MQRNDVTNAQRPIHEQPSATDHPARPEFGALFWLILVYSVFTFVFQFAWEVLQTPFFVRMPTMSHWAATLICFKATIGDVGIALAAFAAGALRDKRPDWIITPSRGAIAIYLAVGVLITIAFEWYAVYLAHRWAYAELMPLVPWLRVGLTPILQWLLLPPLILYFVRRHYIGGR